MKSDGCNCSSQVFNRVIAPMAGNPGNEALALHSENVLKQALQARDIFLSLPCHEACMSLLHAPTCHQHVQ